MPTIVPQRPAQTLTRCTIQGAHLLSCLRSWNRFTDACAHPERHQSQRLKSYLALNSSTSFGAEHNFHRIDSLKDYQAKVPIRTFPELEPWIDNTAAGAKAQLTCERVVAFEPTSGSSSARKLIPYTRTFLQEIQAAVDPWLFDLRARHPGLLAKSSYWSVSSAKIQGPEQSAGGIPIGLQDDTEYFGPIARWALRKTLAVDPSVSQIQDHDHWRRATAQALLEDQDLGFVSVWHPSFFSLLLEYIEHNFDELIGHLPQARQRVLAQRRASHDPKTIWPGLELVSCWTHGPAQGPSQVLQARCPNIKFQGKGLMATEGVVSIPVSGAPAPVLALTSHFFEFKDLQAPLARPLLGHELRVGGHYQPILSTGAGLYRYALGDVVSCQGFWRNAPCLVFEGRNDQRVDLTGEKLDMHFVQQALEKAKAMVDVPARFLALTAQQGQPAGYLLCADLADQHLGSLEQLARATEEELCRAHHYQVSRRNGQLRPVQGLVVPNAANRYLEHLSRSQMTLGNIKPTCLIADPGWMEAAPHG